MADDDGIVELDAGVEHLVRVAAALPVAVANALVEQARVLRRVDLDVLAAEAAKLCDFPAREVDEIRQVGVARRIRRRGALGVVVGGSLLGAEECYTGAWALEWGGSAPFFAAIATAMSAAFIALALVGRHVPAADKG